MASKVILQKLLKGILYTNYIEIFINKCIRNYMFYVYHERNRWTEKCEEISHTPLENQQISYAVG